MAYLLGSIPSAYLMGRWLADVDIRTLGDGNMGAKNVYHQFGLIPAGIVMLADIGKGSLSIWVAQHMALAEFPVFLVGFAAVLGHDWPIFARFRGGQGQAASVGVLLMLLPQETVVVLGVTGALVLATRRWNLSNSLGFALLPLLAWWSGRPTRLVVYPIALLPSIGVKKLIDLPRARRLAFASSRQQGSKQLDLAPSNNEAAVPSHHQ